jgi:hypothetical protein
MLSFFRFSGFLNGEPLALLSCVGGREKSTSMNSLPWGDCNDDPFEYTSTRAAG